jgi:uncharacterized integral membrane protein
MIRGKIGAHGGSGREGHAMGTEGKTRTILTTRRLLWLVGIATFFALVVLFVADNFVLIEVRLFGLRIEMRLAWALLFAFLFGGVQGLVLGRFWQRASRQGRD